MKLTNAIKRLERAGNPKSATNAKLRAACIVVVDHLVALAAGRITDLPRGYSVAEIEGRHVLLRGLAKIDSTSSLRLLHRLSHDVASGLVVETHDTVWTEERIAAELARLEDAIEEAGEGWRPDNQSGPIALFDDETSRAYPFRLAADGDWEIDATSYEHAVAEIEEYADMPDVRQ